MIIIIFIIIVDINNITQFTTNKIFATKISSWLIISLFIELNIKFRLIPKMNNIGVQKPIITITMRKFIAWSLNEKIFFHQFRKTYIIIGNNKKYTILAIRKGTKRKNIMKGCVFYKKFPILSSINFSLNYFLFYLSFYSKFIYSINKLLSYVNYIY